MNPKQPDVVINLESSVFTNPSFKKPDAPQSETQTATEVNVPESTVKFNNPHQARPEVLAPVTQKLTFHSPESLGLLSVDSKISVLQ